MMVARSPRLWPALTSIFVSLTTGPCASKRSISFCSMPCVMVLTPYYLESLYDQQSTTAQTCGFFALLVYDAGGTQYLRARPDWRRSDLNRRRRRGLTHPCTASRGQRLPTRIQ